MSNLIVTGGYGISTCGNSYADIDWTKSKNEITFKIASINDLKFNIITNNIAFNAIPVNNINFSINNNNIAFKINSFDLKFNTKMCI